MLRIYKFKRFGLLRREGVLLDGKCMDLTGFGFIPRLGWRYRHRRWLGIARVSIAEPPAQARQHTANRMQENYKGNSEL